MSTDAIPFRPALEPWVGVGRHVLGNRFDAGSLLAPTAQADLVGWLGRDLVDAAAPTLLAAFLDDPDRTSMSPRSEVDYTRFVAHLCGGGMDAIVRGHPQLAGTLDGVVVTWSQRVEALLAALVCDRDVIAHELGARWPVRHAVPLGDAVVGVRGDNGVPVIYKGRPMDMDAAFARLLDRLHARGAEPALLAPTVIDRSDHGWMAHVPLRAPTGGPSQAAYWYRVGMLLCIVHALGGGDVHAGNVRVSGAHPVIVDAEVLLRPRRAGFEDDASDVRSTGWLPTVHETERCGMAAVPHGERTSRWVAPATDGMRRRTLRSPLRGIRPAVVAHFACMVEDGGLDQVCAGFAAMHAHVRGDGVPLEVFADCRPRVLLRTSRLYQRAIERSREPDALVSAAARHRELRGVSDDTPPSLRSRPAVAAAVADGEHDAMRSGRVPRFTVPADGTLLSYGGRRLGTAFDRSPLERAAAFLRAMDADECHDQRELITDAVRAAADDRLAPTGWRLRPQPDRPLVGA